MTPEPSEQSAAPQHSRLYWPNVFGPPRQPKDAAGKSLRPQRGSIYHEFPNATAKSVRAGPHGYCQAMTLPMSPDVLEPEHHDLVPKCRKRRSSDLRPPRTTVYPRVSALRRVEYRETTVRRDVVACAPAMRAVLCLESFTHHRQRANRPRLSWLYRDRSL